MTDRQILRAAEICALLNISPSCLYKWIAKGFFPRGFAYGPHTVGWVRADVDAWIETRKQAPVAKSQPLSPTPPWTK